MSAYLKNISRKASRATIVQVTPTSDNTNNINNQNIMKNVFIFTIYAEAFMGINRLYLLTTNKITSVCFHIISVVHVLFLIYFFVFESIYQESIIYNQTLIIEFFVLFVCSNFLQKKKLSKMFRYLATFDETLKISKDVYILTSPKISLFFIIFNLLYYAVESLLLWIFMPQAEFLEFLVNFLIFAHVTEQIFFCVAMKAIFKRLMVLKAHVEKIFQKVEKRNKVEALCENIHLNIEDIHKAYDLLHKSGKNLNSAMNVPMLIMTLASGLSTVVLLKNFVQYLILLQNMEEVEISRVVLIYTIERCIQYTAQIFGPSLYASFTHKQVACIRKLLGEALKSHQMGLIERRKVKAFLLLTQVNEFAYSFLGIIRLDMTMPLGYISICITYFIIAMQFSKFRE